MPDADEPMDVVVVGAPTDDGRGRRVLRIQEESIGVGEVRPMEEGKPLHGEVVKLRPRDGSGRVCDVEVLHRPAAREGAGPPKVATSDYRDNWERIFAASGGATGERPN